VVWDSDPLAPVTRTLIVLTDAKLQDRLALPDPVTVEGVRVHAGLFDDKLTTEENPFRPVTVIVEVPTEPALTGSEVGVAVIEKSWGVKVIVTLWDRDPLVPVTPTWIVFEEAKVQDRFAGPEPVTVLGLTVQDVLFVPRLTIPAKPFWPVTVMVEVPCVPALTVTLVGFAATVKSWTV
jgi:hypothetical protein